MFSGLFCWALAAVSLTSPKCVIGTITNLDSDPVTWVLTSWEVDLVRVDLVGVDFVELIFGESLSELGQHCADVFVYVRACGHIP